MHRPHKNYLVVFGDISRGVTPSGQEFAHVTRVTDRMMLSYDLIQVIPKQVVESKNNTATDYVVPELFEGLVSFEA